MYPSPTAPGSDFSDLCGDYLRRHCVLIVQATVYVVMARKKCSAPVTGSPSFLSDEQKKKGCPAQKNTVLPQPEIVHMITGKRRKCMLHQKWVYTNVLRDRLVFGSLKPAWNGPNKESLHRRHTCVQCRGMGDGILHCTGQGPLPSSFL